MVRPAYGLQGRRVDECLMVFKTAVHPLRLQNGFARASGTPTETTWLTSPTILHRDNWFLHLRPDDIVDLHADNVWGERVQPSAEHSAYGTARGV